MKGILVLLGLLLVCTSVSMKRKCKSVTDSTNSKTPGTLASSTFPVTDSTYSETSATDSTHNETPGTDSTQSGTSGTDTTPSETTTENQVIYGVVNEDALFFHPLPDRPDPPVGVPTSCDIHVDFFIGSKYLKSACYYRTEMSYYDGEGVCLSTGSRLFVNGQEDLYPLSQFVDYHFWSNEKDICASTNCMAKIGICCEFIR